MRRASVIVDIPTRALDKPFDYLVPADMRGLEIGCCVLVDFSNRPVVGYVVGLDETPADADLGRYRFIREVLSTPYFDSFGAECASWISHEYVSPLSEAVRLFTPPGASPKVRQVACDDTVGDGLAEGDDASGCGPAKGHADTTGSGRMHWELQHPDAGPVADSWVHITEEGRAFTPPRAAVKQQAILSALREGEMRLSELSIAVGPVNATVKSLQKRGYVVVEKRRRIRGVLPELPIEQDTVSLTDGQSKALEAIDAARMRHDGSVVLLDGVTGSGKTEVYLRAIRKVLADGGGAIVLVPEISLTPQAVGRFRARFGEQVAVLHSAMSAGERYDQWDLIRSGSARVVVGARSALFAPLPCVQLIVIDEEHESTYKQESSPRYCARDVAEHMMRQRKGTLVLGSATPSMESLQRASEGRYQRIELPERARHVELPPVHIVDMGKEFGAGHRSMFSRALTDALLQTCENHHKAVLLLNKRGFASFLLCRECGYVPACDSCSTSLTYHEKTSKGPLLMCHHCGATHEVPLKCPRCGSPYLRKFGAGTQRVHDELRALVGPDVTIVRMDADTTATKGSHERLLTEFAAAESGILLGTQMIAKGLDFPDITLVGVINADTTLNIPDFRSGERTYQLLEQVSGRAGRDVLPGQVFVQTYWADHPAIQAAAHHDRSLFLEPELATRRELCYPPFARLANIIVSGRDGDTVMQSAFDLDEALEATVLEQGSGPASSWRIMGPSPCVLSRLRGVWRWHILIKAPVGSDIPTVIGPALRAHKSREGVSVAVDVDPSDLF